MKTRLLLLLLFQVLSISLIAQKNKTILVIGGGMAGVSAAYYIHKVDSNTNITIIEKEEILGGNAQTIHLLNKAGKQIHIDIGPQYFTTGPWDDYLQFLQENNAYNMDETFSMVGSITIQSKEIDLPILTTPIDGDFRNEKLSKLLKFRKFNIEANKVYKHPEKWNGKTIENWVNGLNFNEDFKQSIIYPFLAASLGTNVAKIKTTAVAEIVKLFAFRKPKQKDTFSIMQNGMGTIIDQLAKQFPKEINTLNSTEAIQLLNDSILQIKQNGNLRELQYDYIVFAIHPYQASQIIGVNHLELSNELSSFTYFDAHIVVHRDSSFVSRNFPSFLNVNTDNSDVVSCTMNLGMISNDFQGIYKTWMQDSELDRVKSNGTLIHEHIFKHPLITPIFIEKNLKIHTLSMSIPNLSIIGAWSEGLETQNSAVLSGKRAANEYLEWKKTH